LEDRQLQKEDASPCAFHLMNENPPIIMYSAILYPRFYFQLLGRISEKRKIYLIYLIPWTLHEWGEGIREEYEAVKRRYPNIEAVYLCNSPEEYSVGLRLGLPSIHVNHNAFLDESLYLPLPSVKKQFDAIYNAAFSPYKRHYLARDIKKLALIGNQYKEGEDGDDYLKSVTKALPNASNLNYSKENGFRWIKAVDLPTYLNQARVGLCLSSVEGTMYACTEYLLCGLPVVSTRSLGGRDIFFDDQYTRVVDDDPAKVAEAVEELARLDIEPGFIRSSTLNRLKPHRERFNQYIEKIFEKEKVPLAKPTNGWHGTYTNKMIYTCTETEVRAALSKIDPVQSHSFEVLPWNGYSAALSLSFGGGEADNYLDSVIPEISQRGFRATFNLAPVSPGRQTERLKVNDWKNGIKVGHQMGIWLADDSGSSESKAALLKDAKITIEDKLGVPLYTYARPVMGLSPDFKTYLSREYFLGLGGWAPPHFLMPGFEPDWFEVPSFGLSSEDGFEKYQDEVERCIYNRSWIIFAFQNINDSSTGWGTVHKPTLTKLLECLTSKINKLWIAPFGEVGAYWRAQVIFENSQMDQGSSRTIISWNRPDLFPEGIVLKVRFNREFVNVFQKDKKISQDLEGWYPISFDALKVVVESV